MNIKSKSTNYWKWYIIFQLLCVNTLSHNQQAVSKDTLPAVYRIPIFHPSCRWLNYWSAKQNYSTNSYFNHLDFMRRDFSNQFVLSEYNRLIFNQSFAPKRFEEIRLRIGKGSVELPNVFFT